MRRVISCASSGANASRPLRRLRALARSTPERASELLRDALALWRGPALADLADEPFARDEIARLENLRIETLEERIEADMQGWSNPDIVAELETLVVRYPLRERLAAQLMRALSTAPAARQTHSRRIAEHDRIS